MTVKNAIEPANARAKRGRLAARYEKQFKQQIARREVRQPARR